MTPTEQVLEQQKKPGIRVEWTINIGTVAAFLSLLISGAIQWGTMATRMNAVEAQNVAQAVANEKLAATVQRLDGTLTRLMAQVEERQRQAELRMDRGDFRQDRAELSRGK